MSTTRRVEHELDAWETIRNNKEPCRTRASTNYIIATYNYSRPTGTPETLHATGKSHINMASNAGCIDFAGMECVACAHIWVDWHRQSRRGVKRFEQQSWRRFGCGWDNDSCHNEGRNRLKEHRQTCFWYTLRRHNSLWQHTLRNSSRVTWMTMALYSYVLLTRTFFFTNLA